MNTNVSIEDLGIISHTIAGIACPDMVKELEMRVNPVTQTMTFHVHHAGHSSLYTRNIDKAVREYNKIEA